MGQEAAEEALSQYSEHLNTLYTDNMAAKLGLLKYNKDIAVQLMTLMYEAKSGEGFCQGLTNFLKTFEILQYW